LHACSASRVRRSTRSSTRPAITPAIAARLGKLFGDGLGIWLRMQAAHDAWVAEREIDVSDIPTLHASRS